MRHLSVVPDHRPAPGQPFAYVPVKLLLAASGRCSCDECCHAAVTSTAVAAAAARPSRGTDRQPVRNLRHLS